MILSALNLLNLDYHFNLDMVGLNFTNIHYRLVVCSDQQQSCYCLFFKIVNANFIELTSDIWHPVSINRQFGLIEKQDRTYTFYTRGADRATTWWDNLIHNTIYGDGVELWTKIMNIIRNLVGIINTTVPTLINYILNWSELKEQLEKSNTINHVLCYN